MPMPPAFAVWRPSCSLSMDFQMSPAVPLPYTPSAFCGSSEPMKVCSTMASNFCIASRRLSVPLGGWLILSAEGDPVPFFGLTLPPLVAPDKELAETIEEIHETAGTAGYWLIGLHAAGALFHHYVVRDNTLLRMLGRGRSLR